MVVYFYDVNKRWVDAEQGQSLMALQLTLRDRCGFFIEIARDERKSAK